MFSLLGREIRLIIELLVNYDRTYNQVDWKTARRFAASTSMAIFITFKLFLFRFFFSNQICTYQICKKIVFLSFLFVIYSVQKRKHLKRAPIIVLIAPRSERSFKDKSLFRQKCLSQITTNQKPNRYRQFKNRWSTSVSIRCVRIYDMYNLKKPIHICM